MAEVTEVQIAEAVKNIKLAFSDGFQLEDLSVMLREVTTFASVFSLTGAEKKVLALKVAERVLEETDIPGLPDKLTLPFVGDVGADALIMRFLPKLIDLLIDVDSRKLQINPTPE